MFEQAILLAYWRTLQTSQSFDNAPDEPMSGGEIAEVIKSQIFEYSRATERR